MTCIICYENMDMLEFNDPHQSTQTCFKLECGHSFHTRCIVSFLTRTNHECPSCNKYRSNEQVLEMEGLVKKLLIEIKNDPEIKEYTSEYKISKQEYIDKINLLKKEIKEFIKIKAKELKIDEHRSYFFECISKLKTEVRKKTMEKSNKHIGAAAFSKEKRYCRFSSFESVFLGFTKNYWSGWSLYKLKRPRLRFCLTNEFLKQEQEE